MDVYDICIIGGGAAGMMAAFSARAHHTDARVIILDHTFELGRKILVAGAGRGNLTNANLDASGPRHFYGNEAFIKEVFSQYDGEKIASFFVELGIPLYEEQKTGRGKIFPVVDNAKTVRDILVDELLKKNIVIQTATEVTGLVQKNKQWLMTTDKGDVLASNVILACGGMTYPALGANGKGYALAKTIGHTIIEPVPSAVPLVTKNILCHLLQGEKVTMGISTSTRTFIGDVLFTQYGISGSAVLDSSRDISIALNREHQPSVSVYVSFLPGKNEKEILEIVENRFAKNPDALISRSLWGLFTVKVANAICAASDIQKETTVDTLTSDEKMRVVATLARYELVITGTRGWNEAEFTSGGVVMDEVIAHTLASKKASHIYFAGEILDIDGDIGGYNLSWAWASGWVAGQCRE